MFEKGKESPRARTIASLEKIRNENPENLVTLPGITTEDILDAFHNLDLDENGYIGAMELKYVLNQLGQEASDIHHVFC